MKNEANTKRIRRTPEQIVADMEADLQAAKARAAKAAATDNPELAPLRAEIDQLRASKRKASVILGDGKQSAAARRALHQAWIEKIDAEEAEAREALESADAKLEDLVSQLETRAAELAG
jgi:hypothetical protein